MRQWREVKSRHADALVFFRVGDFYELFCEDAEEGAELLDLTLTSRNNGAASRVPLAGVPAKALDDYLVRLVRKGRKVAICEQVEDAADAQGIVRREVVDKVTPGTVVSDALLEARRPSYLVALLPDEEKVGIAALDISTGELHLQEVASTEAGDELERLEPREILLPESAQDFAVGSGRSVTSLRPDWLFDAQVTHDELKRRYKVHSLDGFGFGEGDELLWRTAGALLAYAEDVRPGSTEHLLAPRIRRPGSLMTLDPMTRRNLELVEPLGPDAGGSSLLGILDATATPMGARRLRSWVLSPLLEIDDIRRRHDGVEELVATPEARSRLRSALAKVKDLDRLATKVGSGRANPREVLALGSSLGSLRAVAEAAEGLESEALAEAGGFDTLDEVAARVASAVSPEAPAAIADGGVIREGFSEELDEARASRDAAQDAIAGMQARERERTGIASLKVGFNRVFGYYIEVTRANLDRVPEDFIRRQTLVNAERYFTLELKEWEEKVFESEERIERLEQTLFLRLRAELALAVGRIQRSSQSVATLDAIAALAEVAEARGYVRPEIDTGFGVRVIAGRHPVVEAVIPGEDFIPNDIELDAQRRVVILTGPNMAGKSTVLRQVGLIQIMAQIGSFVPADEARLGVCDRVFTRVGASDNLARGQSTFMVEMSETAAIVHGATERSLILLDEIGRGTSTYDGVSIAWALAEHIHDEIGAKAVFATHYHELTQLAESLGGVKNLNVAVREAGGGIVFLRRLEEGGADRSYGIQVARLAGLPPGLISRAVDLLAELEGSHADGGIGRQEGRENPNPALRDQMSLFEVRNPVVERLRELDVENVTPLEALNALSELRAMARTDSE